MIGMGFSDDLHVDLELGAQVSVCLLELKGGEEKLEAGMVDEDK